MLRRETLSMKSHASLCAWRSFFSFVSGEAGTCYSNLRTVWKMDMPGAVQPEKKNNSRVLPVNGKSEKLLNSSGKILHFPQVKGMFSTKLGKASRGKLGRGKQYRGKKLELPMSNHPRYIFSECLQTLVSHFGSIICFKAHHSSFNVNTL